MGGTAGTAGTTGGLCPQGEIVCEGDTAKVCDGMGGFDSETPCADVCVEGLGCKLCVPGESQCNGDTVETCDPNGDTWVPTDTCDPIQGQTCDPQFGACTGACSKGALGLSYIGCDYYPTVTQQIDYGIDQYCQAPHQFAVAVANTSGNTADVTVTRGAMTVDSFQVPAGDVVVRPLPWIDALCKTQGPSTLVADGAYRLRSTQPVTVYQYNPLAATVTNDASLLLPVNAWQSDYVVASWPHWTGIGLPGFYAVVASEDGTTVTLTPSATGGQVQAGGGVAANGAGQVTLQQGDVLQVVTSGGDLTGTRVTSDKPIQVFGGHECTQVPIGTPACDHLEEALFPVDALAKEYFVAPPIHPSNPNAEKGQIVRIVATEPNTQLSYDPPQGGLATSITNAGDFIESPIGTTPFKVTADKKVLVVQYMVSQNAGYGLSDPAMLIAVPSEQYRQDYLFHAATNWVVNFVDIIAPDGASVTVDGAPVPAMAWKAIGATGWSWAHVQLSNAGTGNHTVAADQGVGISVYGVQDYGSYWYPGGLDLSIIPQ
ncbi:MAG: hypothetical protein D6705_16000 [Deltaproteobacteria bacterium]|nr:MAG: hypothetical protein D6705_16000 [Deltaproteobacteria bacterium]